MGLDQYAYLLTREEAAKRDADEKIDHSEDFYWRKHNRLQGWMENLWLSKGNEGEFNCEDVVLSEDDLRALERDIEGEGMPMTEGFFFGSDSYEDYKHPQWGYYKKDCEFIKAALDHVRLGGVVVYSSWW